MTDTNQIRAVWNVKHKPPQYVALRDEKDFALLRALASLVGARAWRRVRGDKPPSEMIGLPTQNLTGVWVLEGSWEIARQACNPEEVGSSLKALAAAHIDSGSVGYVCEALGLAVPDEKLPAVAKTDFVSAEQMRYGGKAYYAPDALTPLNEDERAELLRLRNEARALKDGNSDLAMGASIKLAAARMT